MRSVVVLVLAGTTAHAQPTTLFDQLAQRELVELRASVADASDKVARSDADFYNVAVETPAVDPTTGFTAAERAAAVVSTSVDGAKAGVILAPLAFSRRDAWRGVTAKIAECETIVNAGRAACELDQPFDPKRDPPPTLTAARASIASLLQLAGPDRVPLLARAAVQVLGDYKPARPLDCVTDKKVAAEVRRWTWAHPWHKVSVGAFVDLLPLTHPR